MRRKRFCITYFLNSPIKVTFKSKSLSLLPHFLYQKMLNSDIDAKLFKRFLVKQIKVNSYVIERPLIFRKLGAETKGKILEAGCCESPLGIELASLGYEVYGVDVRMYPFKHPNFHFSLQDMRNLAFKDHLFDWVISLSTIEHIGLGGYGDPIDEQGDKRAFENLKRALKPNGKMMITLPYGVCATTPWYRIYDDERLMELIGDLKIEEAEFLVENGGYWIITSKEEARKVDSSKEPPEKSVIFLVLSKKADVK